MFNARLNVFEYAGKRWGRCEIHGGVISSYVV